MPRLCAGVRVADLGCGAGSLTLGTAAAVASAEVRVYPAALSDARATASAALPALDRANRRERAVGRGWITGAAWDRLAKQIATWADDETSVAAFAECAAVAVKPKLA